MESHSETGPHGEAVVMEKRRKRRRKESEGGKLRL